jgi:hypothetical protein
MDQLAGRDVALDPIQEADELLVAMALHALTDDRPVQDVERGEQRGRPVALVVVRHRAGPAFLHRQPRLRPVKRLDLRFLIDREHHGMRRRVDIEPDHVVQLGGERRVGRQLERPHPVRLEAVCHPDPLHGSGRDADLGRHVAHRPMGRLARWRLQRAVDHPVDQLARQPGNARRPGLVAP